MPPEPYRLRRSLSRTGHVSRRHRLRRRQNSPALLPPEQEPPPGARVLACHPGSDRSPSSRRSRGHSPPPCSSTRRSVVRSLQPARPRPPGGSRPAHDKIAEFHRYLAERNMKGIAQAVTLRFEHVTVSGEMAHAGCFRAVRPSVQKTLVPTHFLAPSAVWLFPAHFLPDCTRTLPSLTHTPVPPSGGLTSAMS